MRSDISALAKRNAHASGGNCSPKDFPGQTLLTPRELEVPRLIATGASNTEVGRRLGIDPRTVEVRRARIVKKIGARNTADLVRIVLGGGAGRVPSPLLEMVA